MIEGFVIDGRDNVATVLGECPAGELVLLRGDGKLETITPRESIRAEHKIALVDIATGGDVVKYGMVIGSATRDIAAGEWVHLHNCGSNFDERSNRLDGETGEPSDIRYE